jgi:hypothetical protein
MQVYVRAGSKRELNDRLAAGAYETLAATEYSMAGPQVHLLASLPSGTVIKIFDKYAYGSPYAKSYGTWDAAKRRVR